MASRIERNQNNIAARTRNVGGGATTSTSETATENAVSGAGDDGSNSSDSNDRDTDRMGSVPSFTQADFQPEFRISVRPPPGGTKTPVPALFDDWHGATLDAAAKERGEAELAPELGQARNAAEQQLGRPLERWEVRQVHAPVLKALLPPIRARHYAAITMDSGSKQQAIDSSLKDHGQRLQKARDPFTPLALGDPAARAKDRVLWENPKFMVIVDSFSPGPKALVIPKKSAMFPSDISTGDLEEMAKLAAKVSDAFGKAAGSGPASIWVNPPQRLTIKQLHTHVLPKLPHWENPGPGEPGGRDPRSDVPAHIMAEMNQFHTALEAELAKVL